MKKELWNGHEIRFVEKDSAWWAVAKDVADALGFRDAEAMARRIDSDEKTLLDFCDLQSVGFKISSKTRSLIVLSEYGVYEAILGSQKPEAKDFKRWVKHVLKTLREATGLEGFEVFRLLDKEHQKAAMQKLQNGLYKPVRVDFIKANSIANKTVSSMWGYPKMVKKGEMNAEMLKVREPVLDDIVNLMTANESFGLGLSVSGKVYEKYGTRKVSA